MVAYKSEEKSAHFRKEQAKKNTLISLDPVNFFSTYQNFGAVKQ
jgi:hypothetical protein